jgi:hypothetical protein
VIAETVCLVNRTNRMLKATFDGADIPIHPGENHGFPAVVVPYAKAQNRIMGSTDPYSPVTFASLVGVKGTADPVTPIEQSDKQEVFDRSKLGGLAGQAVVMPGSPVTAWEAREGMKSIDGGALSES